MNENILEKINLLKNPKICVLGDKGSGKTDFINKILLTQPYSKYFIVDVFNVYEGKSTHTKEFKNIWSTGLDPNIKMKMYMDLINQNSLNKIVVFDNIAHTVIFKKMNWIYNYFPSYIVISSSVRFIKNKIDKFDYIISMGEPYCSINDYNKFKKDAKEKFIELSKKYVLSFKTVY